MVKIAKPFVTNGDESPAYWQIGNLWQIMATGVQTDNAFTLLDQIVHDAGGGGPVTHTHTQEEGLYVISGKCTFNAGGIQGLQGTPGTFVSVPGNTEHSFTVDAPDTHILNFYLPAGFEQLLIGLSHPAKERKPPPPELIGEMMPPAWLAEKLSNDYGETSVLGNPFVDHPDPAKMMTRPLEGATEFPFITNAENIASFVGMGGRWTILANGEQTGGSYCLLEVKLKKGVIVLPRIYKERDEMFYILGGRMTFMLADKIVTAETGALVYIPEGTLYSFRVDSNEAHCLNLHTKSGFEKLVEYCGVEVPAGGTELEISDGTFLSKRVDLGVRFRLLENIGMQEFTNLTNPLLSQ